MDIDAQAVEVTKLSLVLKILENENAESAGTLLSYSAEKMLPDLSNNIKCGNSLIGSDFYKDKQMDMFDAAEMRKVNAFDWEKEFPAIFAAGGFDVVIGNPPYVLLQSLESERVFKYMSEKYESAAYKIDTYQIFLEKSIGALKRDGLLGYINPNTFLKNIHSEKLRAHILNNCKIIKILLLPFSVFRGASVDVCVNIFSKEKSNAEHQVEVYEASEIFLPTLKRQVAQDCFLKADKFVFNVSIDEVNSKIIDIIERKSEPLGLFFDAYFGIQTFDRKKYVSDEKVNADYEPIIDGSNIHRYFLGKPIEYVHFIPSAIKSGGKEHIYRKNRICIRQIGQYPIATYVPKDVFTLNTIYNVHVVSECEYDIKYFLGVINSSAIRFWWGKTHYDEKATFPKIKKDAILSIPIAKIATGIARKTMHDQLVSLVDQMLVVQKDCHAAKESDKAILKQKIDAIDAQIDTLVYELYGLTKEEIAIVEGKAK